MEKDYCEVNKENFCEVFSVCLTCGSVGHNVKSMPDRNHLHYYGRAAVSFY